MNEQLSSQPNFWNAAFDEISLDHIEWLKEMEFEEGINLDYKKEVKDKESVLRDLVSLANAHGGYLLYGIVGEPKITEIKGIQDSKTHAKRIFQWVHNHIKPNILGLRTKTIPVEGERSVLLVYIPMSPNRPHMIDLKDGHQSFYVRREDHNFPMTIDEIKTQVEESISAMHSVREYLEDRKANTKSSHGPERSWFFISATPYYLAEEKIGSFCDAATKDFLNALPQGASDPLFSQKPWVPTLEGIRNGGSRRYIDIYRSGHSEYCTTYFFGERNEIAERRDLRYLPGRKINDIIYRFLVFVRQYMNFFKIYDPIVFSVNLFYVWNSFLSPSPQHNDIQGLLSEGKRVWHPQFLESPLIRLDNQFDIPEAYHELADRIWNAFGYEVAPEP